MPSRLPENYKTLVIQAWLSGEQRDKIAADNGISAGSVTNIVNEWRAALGFPTADALRELGVTLRKVGITAAECAAGSRISTIIKKIGIKEDNFESFILDVYNRCKDIGLSAESISLYLQDLLEFSKDAIIPLSQISSYIKGKTDEKKKLEKGIEERKIQLETLEKEKEQFESLRDQALQEQKMTLSELKWYLSLKQELQQKYSIHIEEISNFAKLLDNIDKHYGYDAGKVIKEFLDLDKLRKDHDFLASMKIPSLQKDVAGLEAQRSILQIQVEMNNQTISKYKDLEAMGFGLHELTFLSNTVNEIAFANGIPAKKAVKKFLADVEEQYDKKLGFESRIEKLKSEVSKLCQQELKLLGDINAIPRLAIIVAKLLNLHHDNSNSSSIEEEIELLIDQVQKCGGIKAALNKLSQSEHHDKESHDVGTRAESLVLVDYQVNKNSSSNGNNIVKEEKEEEQRPLIVSAPKDNHDDDPPFVQMTNKAILQISPPDPPDPPSFLRDSSSTTTINESSHSTEYDEERKIERLVDDISKKNSSKEQEEAAKLAADRLFRVKLDKVLGKEKNSPQNTTL